MTIDSNTTKRKIPRDRPSDWHLDNKNPHPHRYTRLLTGKEVGGDGQKRKVWVRDMGDMDENGRPVDPPHIIFTVSSATKKMWPELKHPVTKQEQWTRVPLKPGQDEHHAIAKIERLYGMPHRFHPRVELSDDELLPESMR